MTTIMMSTTTMTKNFMMITTTMTCHKNHVKSQEDDRVIKKLIGNMEVRIVCLQIRICSFNAIIQIVIRTNILTHQQTLLQLILSILRIKYQLSLLNAKT